MIPAPGPPVGSVARGSEVSRFGKRRPPTAPSAAPCKKDPTQQWVVVSLNGNQRAPALCVKRDVVSSERASARARPVPGALFARALHMNDLPRIPWHQGGRTLEKGRLVYSYFVPSILDNLD